MRSNTIVIDPPGFDFCFCIPQISEPVFVQTLIPELSVEALDEGVLDGFPRADEMKCDSSLIGPGIQGFAGEFGTVVDHDDLWQPPCVCKTLEDSDNATSGQRCIDFDYRALTGEIVDDVQGAESSACGQGIVREVHRPALVCSNGKADGSPEASGELLATLPADSQAIRAIEPVDSLVVHLEAFSSQQDVEPSIPESRSLGSQLMQTPEELCRLFPSRFVLKARTSESQCPAGTALAHREVRLKEARGLAVGHGL